jgi:hypothetical protein
MSAGGGQSSGATASGGTQTDNEGGGPGAPPTPGGALGAYPFAPSPLTQGGTLTFTNVGAPGFWPRRLNREAGDPACDYKDGADTWGGHCCLAKHHTASDRLAPFDEEMTLILKAVRVKQFAVYQPGASERWSRVSAWDERTRTSHNLWLTQRGAGAAEFTGDFTRDDCVNYVMQTPSFDCGDGRNYFCPSSDPGILHQGWAGSKLVIFLGNMDFEDAQIKACEGAGAGHPGPWVAFVASELTRDGARKWNGLCNCYSKTGTVGDGCGEINVFEVVMDGNQYSNREFMSTGVRSYQAGHVGGSVCGTGCARDAFPADAEVVDACSKQPFASGPSVPVGGASSGCPVWKRPRGDRYFFILMDEPSRTIQVGILHPGKLPEATRELLPTLPSAVSRNMIDALVKLRLPQ